MDVIVCDDKLLKLSHNVLRVLMLLDGRKYKLQ